MTMPRLALADPIVTRYHPDTGQLEMLAVERIDTKQWSIPGGMLTSQGDQEAMERTLNIIGIKLGAEVMATLKSSIKANPPEIVFCGYVDDPRNTDNAWLEVMPYITACLSLSDSAIGEDRARSHAPSPRFCRRRRTTSTTRAHR